MAKLVIIHTTPATVEPLKILAAEILPGCVLNNIVDDTILPQLANNGGNLAEVENRLIHYARFAEQAGANIILEACSSVGEIVPKMQQAVGIPVVRIDEPMAEEAILSGAKLGVAATLPTTLQPTTRLLKSKAQTAGRPISVTPVLIIGAFEKLTAGDRDGHDTLVAAALKKLAGEVDVVVLAQASMARVVQTLPTTDQGKFLSSPRLGMERVRSILQKTATIHSD